MTGRSIVVAFRTLGYHPQLDGDKVLFVLQAGADPDPDEVEALAQALRRHKPEVVAYLKAQAQDVPPLRDLPLVPGQPLDP
jgi:hypothetical protein